MVTPKLRSVSLWKDAQITLREATAVTASAQSSAGKCCRSQTTEALGGGAGSRHEPGDCADQGWERGQVVSECWRSLSEDPW